MSPTVVVVDVVDETTGHVVHQHWSEDGSTVTLGHAAHPDVTEYRRGGSCRWVLHLPVGDAHGVYPPTGSLGRDVDVFDPAQRVVALIDVADGPAGPTTFRFEVEGSSLSVDEVGAASALPDTAADLRFGLTFREFLSWVHLDNALGPALWFSEQIWNLDVFGLSLLEGVVSAPATAPPIGDAALPAAVDLACRLAELRHAAASGSAEADAPATISRLPRH